MTKPRTYEAHGKMAEIIGPSTRCVVFINGASHPCFQKPFKSIRAARIRFMRWAESANKP
mgnify:CR=1 FL=1